MKDKRLPIYRLYHFGVAKLPDPARAELGDEFCALTIGRDGQSIIVSRHERGGEAQWVSPPACGTLLIPPEMLDAAGITEFALLHEEEKGHYKLTETPPHKGEPHPKDAPLAEAGTWFNYYFDEEKLTFTEVSTLRNLFVLGKEKLDDSWESYLRWSEERLVKAMLSKLMVRKYPL